jgi:hypothetical protein
LVRGLGRIWSYGSDAIRLDGAEFGLDRLGLAGTSFLSSRSMAPDSLATDASEVRSRSGICTSVQDADSCISADVSCHMWLVRMACFCFRARGEEVGFSNVMLGGNETLTSNIGLEAIWGLHDSGLSKTHTRSGGVSETAVSKRFLADG